MKKKIPRINHMGERFGTIVVVKYIPSSQWLCVCDCGSSSVRHGTELDEGCARCHSSPNKVSIHPDHAQIHLRDGYIALVDLEDVDFLRRFHWKPDGRESERVYADTNISGNHVDMHAMVLARMGLKGMADHIHGNTLDNRRSQLRVATNAQNSRNTRGQIGSTSIYKGVSWDPHKHLWRARIRVDDRQIFIGRFTNQEDAARAYDSEAKLHFGAYARLNFPPVGHANALSGPVPSVCSAYVPLPVGAKIKFTEERQRYTIRAANEYFAVCTKPFNPLCSVQCTVVDWRGKIRGTVDRAGYSCADTDEQCREMLVRLENNQVTIALSSRIDLNIEYSIVPPVLKPPALRQDVDRNEHVSIVTGGGGL